MRWLGFLLIFVPSAMVADTPTRIVTAGGDLTEIVVALGDSDKLVGVDTTSRYPPAISDLASIGYVRRLSPEGLLTLTPDLLIGSHDMGPDTALEQLEAAGVTVAIAPEGRGAEAVPEKIAFIAGLLRREDEARDLIAAYWDDMEEVAAKVATIETKPKVLFVLSLREGAPIVGGVETPAHDIITLAGGENVAAEIQGWKTFNQEAIIGAAPDAILVMGSHLEGMGGVESLLARPDIALTPAGRTGNVLTVDGALMLQFGPRTPEGVRALAGLLHPDLDLTP